MERPFLSVLFTCFYLGGIAQKQPQAQHLRDILNMILVEQKQHPGTPW